MVADERVSRTAALLDDNLMFTPRVEAALRALGFRVRTVPPRGDAEARVAELAPDLILLNLASAGAGALELVRRLRARPELAGRFLLAYHNHTDTAAFHAAKAAGADEVVANSAVANHLEAVLRAKALLE
jgi:CheY-like chemotaxis protein